MHERAAEFAERAQDRYGVDLDVLEFDAGTETAAAAADAVGCDTAAIASTIVVSLSGGEAGAGHADGADEDRLVAAITSGANRLDLDAVAERFDATSASMADPERIREVVGWSIGGVPPICHDAALPTVLDPTLTEYDTVHGAAGTPSALFPIDPETLAALADATVVDLTE
ncbi:YbaK/EbsC family protein [Halorubrum sp. CSM-61]|uniref:YbaK/EbsC family protein n=1 Tax=Halorubrum sp. CSM-61 TaxID=2485838 RepID=UPI000F4B247C|nr:YbaK/EbsC family protein [Halorubrum sp. CSM-61]